MESEIKDMLKEFTERYIREGKLGSDFLRLSPKERVSSILKLLPYFCLKQTEKQTSAEIPNPEGKRYTYLPSLFPELDMPIKNN